MKLIIEDGILIKCILEGATSVTVPDGVTKIGVKAFSGKLEDVYIPDSVKVIDDYAFIRCPHLKKVRLSGCLEKIGHAAFGRCGEIKEIDIPESVNHIGGYAFKYCLALEKIVIPEKVKKLLKGTFSNCASLKKVVLPEGLVSISAEAFYGCTGLVDISLPSALKKLGPSSFRECESLKEIDIPSCLKVLDKHCFSYCKSLKTVVFNEGLTKIEEYAFGKCGMESISLPDSITEIEKDAFYGCDNLKKVRLPLHIENIPEGIFKYCRNLEDVSIPESVQTIEADAFYGTGISNLYIPASVRRIGIDPSSCTRDPMAYSVLALNPFAGCQNLMKIEVDSANEFYYSENNCIIDRKAGFVIAGCASSTIPSDVNGIWVRAFNGVSQLEKIDIPDNVHEILDLAFHQTGIKEITIPENTVRLGREIITEPGSLVTYTGNKCLRHMFGFNGGIFLAYPNIFSDIEHKHISHAAIGYGIHCFRTNKKYSTHKYYIRYIQYNAAALIEFAAKYLYPHGIDFLKFVIKNKLINKKDFEKISTLLEPINNPELLSEWIEYKMDHGQNPCSELEKNFGDL